MSSYPMTWAVELPELPLSSKSKCSLQSFLLKTSHSMMGTFPMDKEKKLLTIDFHLVIISFSILEKSH